MQRNIPQLHGNVRQHKGELLLKATPTCPLRGHQRLGVRDPPSALNRSLVGAWALRVTSNGVQGLNAVPKQPRALGGCTPVAGAWLLLQGKPILKSAALFPSKEPHKHCQ